MIKKRDELLQTLISKLMRAIKNMHAGQSFPFENFLLTRQQVMVLFFIYDKEDGTHVKDLAKFLQVTPGAVTQFIDILVMHKLVRREESTKDRRAIRLKLTNSARLRFKQFKINYLISASRAFKDFKTEEIQQFIKLVEKIKI